MPINFVSFHALFCEAVKQETAAFDTDASPNRKQFPRKKICSSMKLDTGNYLTELASVGFHERHLASVKNFNGKDLPL